MRKLALALLALAACHKASGEPGEDTSSGGTSGGASSGMFNTDAGNGVTPQAECAPDTQDIFVVTDQAILYQFHPPTLDFKLIGRVSCATGGATPTSMAVDRQGIAWMRNTDGSMAKVSTKDLSCEPLAVNPPLDQSFAKFGMGFSAEVKGSSAETLFLSDHDGAGLGRLDMTTSSIQLVGPYTGDLAGKTCELTGTGDGTLWGFFVTSPAQIAQISKGTGSILMQKELTGVYAGNAWAFSFYGGDFYIYTSSLGTGGGPPEASPGSDVTRYRPSDGSITVVKQKVGFTIVGAGVSTCAPTTLPH
ncbi:MAG TPA: hypothetical protein VIF62_14570 [Labilithrix sp.]